VTRRIRIAVLAGGRSSEHAISLASARSVIGALDPSRYEVLPVGIDGEGRWHVLAGRELEGADDVRQLQSSGGGAALVPGHGSKALVRQEHGAVLANGIGDVDVVFPVLHGPFGEDGTMQGLLETAGIPYVGAGVLSSAVAMDKDVCKAVLRNAGIACTESVTLRDAADDPHDPAVTRRIADALGWPVFVKPAALGSSVGITKVPGPEQLPAALELAFSHGPKTLVEAFVTGRELECGVLGNDRPAASAVAEILPHADWYDYSAKYDEGGSDIVIPADIPELVAERVREMALTAFAACECSGMARVDFFLRPDGELLVNELNTIPGFTQTSVYARLFEAEGLSYGQLLDRLVELALERFERDRRYRH
jgi:D-alanine-D-alanine ligase